MGDVTGYGKSPLRSTWLKKSGQFYASPQQAVADIWNDWYFDATSGFKVAWAKSRNILINRRKGQV